jgi:hypothetical protein
MSKRARTVRPHARAELICWLDHSEPMTRKAWDAATVPENLVALLVWSAGFVTSENDDIIELSRDATEHGTVGAPVYILKRCIVSRKRIPVRAVRRRG